MSGCCISLNFLMLLISALRCVKPETALNTAEEIRFPFLAEVAFTSSKLIFFKEEKWCYGSVISVGWVLTAASCAAEKTSAQVYLRGSRHKPGKQLVISSNTFIIHPDFNKDNLQHNVALIYIKKFIFSVKPIKLPPFNNKLSYMNNEYTVIGYKEITDYILTNEDANIQFYNMTIIPNRLCSLLQGRDIIDNEMCTIKHEAGYGSSGGPLVVYIPGYDPILLGLYSYFKNNISIHTRLQQYLTWIENETGIMYFHI